MIENYEVSLPIRNRTRILFYLLDDVDEGQFVRPGTVLLGRCEEVVDVEDLQPFVVRACHQSDHIDARERVLVVHTHDQRLPSHAHTGVQHLEIALVLVGSVDEEVVAGEALPTPQTVLVLQVLQVIDMHHVLPLQRVVLQFHEAVAGFRDVVYGGAQRQLTLYDEGGADGYVEAVAHIVFEGLQRFEGWLARVAVVLVSILDLIVPELVEEERALHTEAQRPLIAELDRMGVDERELVDVIDPVRHVVVRVGEAHGALLLVEALVEGEAYGVVSVAQYHPLLPVVESEADVLRITRR